MEGLPHDPRWFDRVVGGFALTGEERDGNSDEPSRGSSVVIPKENVVTYDHVFQNPFTLRCRSPPPGASPS
jgi:hypothetical protein